jgi:hypothetical protein
MSQERKYIYGIAEEPQCKKFSFTGVGGAEVYTINYENLAAAVSDTDLVEIDPTRKNVRAHTIVQDELLRDYTLLPMGFGVMASSDNEVLGLLHKNYQALASELARLAGKIQVELKVFWDPEAVIRQLQSENEEFAKLKARISAASSPDETRSLLIEAGKLVEGIAFNWKTRYADRVYTILKDMALDARLNNPIGIKNLLNASFLIDRSKEKEFQKEVYKLDGKYQGNVNFKYVGPLAPYSFVNLKLEPVD